MQGKTKDKEGKQVARDWDAEEAQLAAVEEQHLVAEFADKLSHNVGLVSIEYNTFIVLNLQPLLHRHTYTSQHLVK